MGGLAIAALIFELVATCGPKAVEVYEDWTKKIPEGKEPTEEMWAALRDKIDSHNPDSY